MRHSLKAVILLAGLVAVAAQAVANPNLIESPTPFTPAAKVEGDREEGELNGVHYSFHYGDGSGIFSGKHGNWSVRCKKDQITDEKFCFMNHQKNWSALWLLVYPKGKVSVGVGHERYPGSSVAIRIDKGSPFTNADGVFDLQTSRRIVQKLAKASSVTTRYMKWPYRRDEDETWDLSGFNEALAYITWAVERIR